MSLTDEQLADVGFRMYSLQLEQIRVWNPMKEAADAASKAASEAWRRLQQVISQRDQISRYDAARLYEAKLWAQAEITDLRLAAALLTVKPTVAAAVQDIANAQKVWDETSMHAAQLRAAEEMKRLEIAKKHFVGTKYEVNPPENVWELVKIEALLPGSLTLAMFAKISPAAALDAETLEALHLAFMPWNVTAWIASLHTGRFM